MTIFRIQKKENYVVLDKGFLNDVNLTWKAKGLLAYMLSLPNDWSFSIVDLATRSKCGREATGNIVKELSKAGYIHKEQGRAERGKFGKTELLVFEIPHSPPLTEYPSTVKPSTEKPQTGNPSTENPSLLINKSLNNNLLNNDLLNKKEKQTTDSEVGQSSVTEEQLIFLTKFYDENIQRASGYICECIEHMAKENDPALVYEAMKITALQQPNKPMQYTERILANWRKDFITNVEQLKAKEERDKNKRQQTNQSSYQKSKGRTEVVPEWFANRNDNEEPTPATESTSNSIDFEAERQKILEKLERAKENVQ